MKEHENKPFFSQKKDDIEKVLYKAIRKYGWDIFKVDILEYINPEETELLKEREQYWIKYYNTYENREDYNEIPGGDLPGKKNIQLGENHGKSKLTEKDVIFCRKKYKEGCRSRKIYEEYFSDKLKYNGFLRMWHSDTWKHVMPEVFENNPHKGKYTASDRDIIVNLFNKSNLSMNQFLKTEECYVGYGTLWKMINQPEFYDGK